jgi:hypothetical protein
MARAATDTLARILMGELQAAMQAGGTVRAIQVCSRRAQAVTDSLSASLGLRIRRISTRWRNPLDAPDSLEAAVLERFDAPDAPEDTLFRRVVDGVPGFAYLRPIRIGKAVCLKCHGDPGGMSPELRRLLAEEYPEDRAVGFRFRELRGAFSVFVPDSVLASRER